MFSTTPECYRCDEYRSNRCDNCNSPICDSHTETIDGLVYCTDCTPWIKCVHRRHRAAQIAKRVGPRFAAFAAREVTLAPAA